MEIEIVGGRKEKKGDIRRNKLENFSGWGIWKRWRKGEYRR